MYQNRIKKMNLAIKLCVFTLFSSSIRSEIVLHDNIVGEDDDSVYNYAKKRVNRPVIIDSHQNELDPDKITPPPTVTTTTTAYPLLLSLQSALNATNQYGSNHIINNGTLIHCNMNITCIYFNCKDLLGKENADDFDIAKCIYTYTMINFHITKNSTQALNYMHSVIIFASFIGHLIITYIYQCRRKCKRRNRSKYIGLDTISISPDTEDINNK